ncbi:MAG: heme-binding protein [Erysipelotrichaceae bacterium]|nr:heme-binding protein [Erysipelotrichaceae bacterium]
MKNYLYYKKQKEGYVLKKFDHIDAFRLGEYICKKMIKETKRAIVHIEINKETVFEFLNSAANPNDRDWLMKKIRCVEYFHEASAAQHVKCIEKGLDPKREYADKDIAALGGAFPILVDGVGAIGVIGISGYEDSFDDHEAAIFGLKHLKKMQDKGRLERIF